MSGDPSSPPSPPQGVAAHLKTYLGEQHERLAASLPRVLGEHDDEAVHDLRVALRRARSLLKPARGIFGVFHTDHVRAGLKSIADATGELRDEEVLAQTIRRLRLPGEAAAGRDAWLARRQERERALRRSLFDLIGSGGLARTLDELRALLTLPVRPSMDKEAVRFATREVNRALRHVEARGIVSLTDGEALHDLRILYKRLRYLAEGFRPLLALEQAELAHHAAKFQKVLGDIHDLDVARAAVIADESLAPEIRGPIQQAVEAERTQQAIEFALRRARVVAEAELLGLAPHAPPEEKRPAPGAASKSS